MNSKKSNTSTRPIDEDMSISLQWHLKRPGLIVPVFFLSLLPVSGQLDEGTARAGALGGCRSTLPGPGGNPAALAWLDRASFSFGQHLPYGLPELGSSRITAVLPLGRGGIEARLGHRGMKGLRYMQYGLARGLRLSGDLAAGLRLGIRHTLIEGQAFHLLAPFYSLGLQYRAAAAWQFGLRIEQLRFLTGYREAARGWNSQLSSGFSYTFFEKNALYTELQYNSLHGLRTAHGLEIRFRNPTLLLGIRSRPFALSAGLQYAWQSWTICLAFTWLSQQGPVPYLNLSHER